MERILTVSIAAYNMGKYIRQTLDSLIVPEILDKLEVFVVDDGGTDGTLAIAQEYEAKYPGTFYAVHKENGGHGSTGVPQLNKYTAEYSPETTDYHVEQTASVVSFEARLICTLSVRRAA